MIADLRTGDASVVARYRRRRIVAMTAAAVALIVIAVVQLIRDPGPEVILLVVGGGLGLWGTARAMADPRRVSNAVIILASVALLTVWVLLLFSRVQPESAALAGVVLCLIAPPIALVTVGIGLLANGIVVTRREGIRIATLTAPVVGVGLVLIVGAFFIVLGPTALPTWLTALAVLAVLLGVQAAGQLVAFTGYAAYYGRRPDQLGSDVIVALGCGLSGDKVTPLLASRLDRAAEVYEAEIAEGGTPILVVSGGQGPGETVAEATAMGEHLVAGGIPDGAIMREDRSRNTEQNLQFTLELLRAEGIDPDRSGFTVVTSDFHVMRSAELTRRARMRAHVVGARTARYFAPTAFLREFVGVLAMHRKVNLAVAAGLTLFTAVILVISYMPI